MNEQTRCFFYSATFHVNNGSNVMNSATQNFGSKMDHFPSFNELKSIVKSENPRAENIVILSICELKEDDFNLLFEFELKNTQSK